MKKYNKNNSFLSFITIKEKKDIWVNVNDTPISQTPKTKCPQKAEKLQKYRVQYVLRKFSPHTMYLDILSLTLNIVWYKKY